MLLQIEKMGDKGDITNPKSGRPISFFRKGEGQKNTSYLNVVFLGKIKFPKPVIDRIEEKLIDLTQVSVPREADQIKNFMIGAPNENGEEVAKSETPACFGKYDEDEEDCLSCDFCDPCEVETRGDDIKIEAKIDDDEDDSSVSEDPDPELDDEQENDELENKLYALAKKRQAARQDSQRTPVKKE
jgi:hypothetical protein